jgi:hypothetical protein
MDREKKHKILSSMAPVDVDTGKLSMGFVTFLLVLGGAGTAAITWAKMPTADAVKEAIMEHANDDSPHSAALSGISEIAHQARSAAIEAKSAADSAKSLGEDNKIQYRYIQARIDFLVENEIQKAPEGSEAMRRTRRAATSVRQRSGAAEGSPGDPLSGVDGL